MFGPTPQFVNHFIHLPKRASTGSPGLARSFIQTPGGTFCDKQCFASGLTASQFKKIGTQLSTFACGVSDNVVGAVSGYQLSNATGPTCNVAAGSTVEASPSYGCLCQVSTPRSMLFLKDFTVQLCRQFSHSWHCKKYSCGVSWVLAKWSSSKRKVVQAIELNEINLNLFECLGMLKRSVAISCFQWGGIRTYLSPIQYPKKTDSGNGR